MLSHRQLSRYGSAWDLASETRGLPLKGRICGLDLFSGIGGLTLALEPWVRPVAYCEIDPYPQGVLVRRMADDRLPRAPIWDDVRTLTASELPPIDIVYGGFPCQDISVAGNGAGLAGERSGLVFEVFRIIAETRPAFVFLENVPAIRTRGAERVVKELASLGYDCRWDRLSAFDVGAPHKRERWWLLAYGYGCERQQKCHGQKSKDRWSLRNDVDRFHNALPDSVGHQLWDEQGRRGGESRLGQAEPRNASPQGWWSAEPGMGRVAYGVSRRAHRLKALGNAVVPMQAREAFRRLMGL